MGVHGLRAWLETRLKIIKIESDRKLMDTSLDEDDIEDIKRCKAIIDRLKRHLDTIFPETSGREQFALHHDDVSAQNLLIDSGGALTALVDWECVSVMPMWKVCQLPAFLRGRERQEKPDRTTYALDQDPKRDLYAEHVEAYEKTLLRQRFLDTMGKTNPVWIEIYKSAVLEADFDVVISQCDNEFCYRKIEKWLNLLDRGILDGAEYLIFLGMRLSWHIVRGDRNLELASRLRIVLSDKGSLLMRNN
jgi:Phosphotransferase enzyme family